MRISLFADGEWRIKGCKNLYDGAFLALAGSSEESGTGGMFEDFPYSIVHLGGTFKVLCGTDLAGDCFSLDN